MMRTRDPGPALRPYVQTLWAMSSSRSPGAAPTRERVLPTGAVHVVFRLADDPLRIYDDIEAPRRT
ncbi:hypothetical protein KJ059_05285 [Myxococcota bacterium]|nr:hypothetical protein [Myxococcota bacterium]MCZ7618687.1 hypothetical protein [Myxococcota bacterium]